MSHQRISAPALADGLALAEIDVMPNTTTPIAGHCARLHETIARLLGGALILSMLGACASTSVQQSVQQYEGRETSKIFEGEGGMKEVVDGVEIWGLGEPPRRYKVLDVVTVEDFATMFADHRIRTAIAARVKDSGGDAAIAIDSAEGARYFGVGVVVNDAVSPAFGIGRKAVRFQVVKYVDKAK